VLYCKTGWWEDNILYYKKSLFVWLKSAHRVHLSSKCARLRETFECHTTNAALSICQFASLEQIDKWKRQFLHWFHAWLEQSWIRGNRRSYHVYAQWGTWGDSYEINETLAGKESGVATEFSWSNVSSQNRGVATKRSKMDNLVFVIDSTPASPQ